MLLTMPLVEVGEGGVVGEEGGRMGGGVDVADVRLGLIRVFAIGTPSYSTIYASGSPYTFAQSLESAFRCYGWVDCLSSRKQRG